MFEWYGCRPADPAVAQPAQQSVGPAVPEGTEGATVDPSGPAETAGVPEEATERTAAAEGLSIAAAASGEATASAGPGPSGDQGPINAGIRTLSLLKRAALLAGSRHQNTTYGPLLVSLPRGVLIRQCDAGFLLAACRPLTSVSML